MYIQLRRYQLKSGVKAEDVRKTAEEKFTKELTQLPGFIDYLIVDSHDGKMFSVSIFKDKSGVDQSKQKSQEFNQQYGTDFFQGAAQIIEGEVLFEGSPDQKLLKAA